MGNGLEHWHDFFVAEAGAAAALAGLLFVAVSINLARILEFPQLPMRVAESLVALLSVLVVTTIGLVPEQSMQAAGAQIAVAALLSWGFQLYALVRSYANDQKYGKYPLRFFFNQVPALPFAFAGAMLWCGHEGGAFWIFPATLLCFASGLFGAWVLLIEIQR